MSCSECQRANAPSRLKPWILLALALVVIGIVAIAGREPVQAPSDGQLRVEVSSEGFFPTSLELPEKRPATVIFRRTSEAACAHAVVFPELKLERELPLERDVAVEIPASVSRSLGFQCGAGEHRGKVLVN
jgi:plastocyanin domain-containing protein